MGVILKEAKSIAEISGKVTESLARMKARRDMPKAVPREG